MCGEGKWLKEGLCCTHTYTSNIKTTLKETTCGKVTKNAHGQTYYRERVRKLLKTK